VISGWGNNDEHICLELSDGVILRDANLQMQIQSGEVSNLEVSSDEVIIRELIVREDPHLSRT
jgi:hypothetical protein